MSFTAIIPVAQIQSANAALELAGYGPNNFGVPLFNGISASHGCFHAWDDPAFRAAVEAIAGVVIEDEETTPEEQVKTISATVGAKWGADAKPLTGTVTAGLHRDADGTLWNVITGYNTDTWPDPYAVPALVRRARQPALAEKWVQPIDQFDAYKLVNAFTGQPDKATHNGKTWAVVLADGGGNNVFAPGVYGWAEV